MSARFLAQAAATLPVLILSVSVFGESLGFVDVPVPAALAQASSPAAPDPEAGLHDAGGLLGGELHQDELDELGIPAERGLDDTGDVPAVCTMDPHQDPATYRIRGHRMDELEVTLADYGIYDWDFPMNSERIMGRPFGYRQGVFDKNSTVFHGGQDIGCAPGESIYAAAAGTVRVSMLSDTAGNFVRLEHGGYEGQVLSTRYLHLTRRLVRTGQQVEVGQRIGTCGSTGASTSAHLHFEVVLDEKRVHPIRHPLPDVRDCLN